MDSSLILLLLLQVVLISLNAIFASAEIAVLQMSEAKLDKLAAEGKSKNKRRAKRLLKLTSEPARFLATIQVAITLSGFLGSAFAADSFSDPLVNWLVSLGVNLPRATLDTVAVIAITLILSYFTLIFGELVPKRIAMKKSEKIALGVSGLVGAIAKIFRPVVWFLSVSTNLVLRICGIDPNEEDEQYSEEEIRMMVDAGSEKGTIDHQEKELIQNIFEFNDITAADIATHRTDVHILWLEDEMDVWANTIHENRHTRYPVCGDTVDNVVGVLNAKDYFRLDDKSRESVMKGAVTPAYFVPETIKADVLFRNMKKTRNSLAIVMDEYGGTVGIVTLYDLIEELVGELNDEPEDLSDPDPHIEQIDERTWRVNGNVELKELEEATGLELVTEDFETFTGMCFDALDMIPDDGKQSIDIDLPRLSVHISLIEAHQIEEATVTLKEISREEEEENSDED